MRPPDDNPGDTPGDTMTRGGFKYRADRDATADEPSINLTPLLDVVLIVLVFFIATASFIPPHGVDIRPAASERATLRDENSVRIALTSDGRIHFNDAYHTPQSLVQALSELPGQSGLAVIIDADRNARVDALLDLIGRLQTAGVSDISLGAERAPPPLIKAE